MLLPCFRKRMSARYANAIKIKSMETADRQTATALKNRKPMKKFGAIAALISAIMGDYDDVEGNSRGPSVRGARGWAAAAVVAALTMAGVDVVWIGFVAKGLFEREIGHLLAEDVNFLAAGLFYVFYVTTILVHYVLISMASNRLIVIFVLSA